MDALSIKNYTLGGCQHSGKTPPKVADQWSGFRRLMWYRAASICASNLRDGSGGRREFNCKGRRIVRPFFSRRRWQETLMKALILYVVFVVIGALIASGIGLLIE